MTNIPKTMQAFVLTGHGGLDMLVHHTDWPVPTPGETDVLIKVGACGLNNTDINTRTGWYSKAVSGATDGAGYNSVGEDDPTWGGSPITLPRIQGADAAGTIVAVGTGVDDTFVGKRVITDNWMRDWSDPMNLDKTGYFGSERDGGYAEYCCIDYRNVGIIESTLSDAELATFSCSYTTAEGMLSRAAVTDADTVLITGASGGVGSALVQLAKRRGARVVGLASPEKHQEILALGADAVLKRTPENLASELKAALGNESVDVVADVVGGDSFGTLLDSLKRGGRYTCSGAIAGPIVDLDLRTFYLNDLTFTGSTVVMPEIFTDVVNYISRGEIKPLLAQTYPLAELKSAQEAFIAKKHTGNIAVTMDHA